MPLPEAAAGTRRLPVVDAPCPGFDLLRDMFLGYAGDMTTLTWDIRQPEVGDADELSRVFAASWNEAYGGIIPGVDLQRIISRRGPTYWTHVAKNATGNMLVASLDDTPCGYATFGHNRHGRIPAQGEIYELYLDPICHGTGTGRRLLEAAIARLGENNRHGVVVWALAANERADRFYRRCGAMSPAKT